MFINFDYAWDQKAAVKLSCAVICEHFLHQFSFHIKTHWKAKLKKHKSWKLQNIKTFASTNSIFPFCSLSHEFFSTLICIIFLIFFSLSMRFSTVKIGLIYEEFPTAISFRSHFYGFDLFLISLNYRATFQIYKIRENVSVNAEPWAGYWDRTVLLLAGEWLNSVESANIADPSRAHESAVTDSHQPQTHLSEEKWRR